MNKFLQGLLGAGLYLLEQSDNATKAVRDRASDRLDDLNDMARDKYKVAADRVSRASDVLQGNDRSAVGDALRFAAGLGIGIGIGLLLAPASGDETRSVISDKVREFGGRVRDVSDDVRSTGTHS